mgnify:CR=1 FL=1
MFSPQYDLPIEALLPSSDKKMVPCFNDFFYFEDRELKHFTLNTGKSKILLDFKSAAGLTGVKQVRSIEVRPTSKQQQLSMRFSFSTSNE